MTDVHFGSHEEHARWLVEQRAWLDDLAQWRAGREQLLETLDQLRTSLATRADLDTLDERIRAFDAEISEHETLIAAHESGGDSRAHDDAEAAHMRARERHEVARRDHASQSVRLSRIEQLILQLQDTIGGASG